MKKRICLTLIIILIAGFALTTFGKDKAMPIVIDVRTVQEWNNGHLEGAVLIPYDQIDEKIGAVVKDKSQKIYLYCRSGHRAGIAKESLEKLGYKDIINLGSVEDAAKNLKRKVIDNKDNAPVRD
jgi:phage shock protein E